MYHIFEPYLINETYLCNGCHDAMQRAMNFNDVTIVSIKGNDYRIHFWCMSKDKAISIMHNSNLNEKNRNIKNLFYYLYNMSGTTYY